MVMHACNLSRWETEVGCSTVPSQPGLFCEFQASLHYIMTPCLKKNKNKKQKNPKKPNNKRTPKEQQTRNKINLIIIFFDGL
jgi:hypothetical protein